MRELSPYHLAVPMQGKGKANDRNNGANQDNCDWARAAF